MENNLKTLVIVLILSIFSMTTFAANTSGEEDLTTLADNPAGAPGDPGAPINDYLLPMLVLGIAVGYRLLRKRTAIVK